LLNWVPMAACLALPVNHVKERDALDFACVPPINSEGPSKQTKKKSKPVGQVMILQPIKYRHLSDPGALAKHHHRPQSSSSSRLTAGAANRRS
jgi:hypothetical protein